MPDRLASFKDDLGFSKIFRNTQSDPVMSYVTIRRVQEVDCSGDDLKGSLFLYPWRTRELIGLADRRVQEREREVKDLFVHHEQLLSCSAVRSKPDIQLSSFDDAVASARIWFGDDLPDPSPGFVVESVQTFLVTRTSTMAYETCFPFRLLVWKASKSSLRLTNHTGL